MGKSKIGIIGCGNISSIYLQNLNQRFASVTVTAVADLVPERARAQAEKYGVPRVLETQELLQDPDVDLVLNLTTPQGHYDICRRALLAGKSVYVEKPLSISLEDGMALKALADSRGLLLGGAPDTFLGAGIQTSIELIDSGVIGRPIGATAFMTCHGHESWHPDPEFYYQVGGGPMFDMGPYYLTALFSLLGPARRLTGSAAISFSQRTITSSKKNGQIIDVEVPTHVAGIIDFVSGAIGTILTSFDVWGPNCRGSRFMAAKAHCPCLIPIHSAVLYASAWPVRRNSVRLTLSGHMPKTAGDWALPTWRGHCAKEQATTEHRATWHCMC